MSVHVKTVVAQTTVVFLIVALALFVPAGTIAWAAGWVYLILFVGFVITVYVWLFRHNPGLLKERMAGVIRSGQKGWDKVLMISLQALCVVWLFLIALDAVRFRWSLMPIWVQGMGAIVLICSFYLIFTTFRENSYLSPVVRIQKDREHTVVSTGPYHYVRHPMYSGIVLFSIGTPLLLGSWYGLLFGLILVGMLARRAVLEEHMLRSELQGYTDYATQVKYRFIPHVW